MTLGASVWPRVSSVQGYVGGQASREPSWENPALRGKVRAWRADVKSFPMGGVVPAHGGFGVMNADSVAHSHVIGGDVALMSAG